MSGESLYLLAGLRKTLDQIQKAYPKFFNVSSVSELFRNNIPIHILGLKNNGSSHSSPCSTYHHHLVEFIGWQSCFKKVTQATNQKTRKRPE